jgi:hypothetical protein
VKMTAFQGIDNAIIHPEHLVRGLAFWAMSVTAAVVAYALFFATVAPFDMSTQSRSPATQQRV